MTGHEFSSDSTSAPQNPTRVLIVDDHPMMREGLAALLSSQPDLISCGAANIREALQLVTETNSDVVVVDIALNGESGLELVRQLQSIKRSLPILVLSLYDDELYAERALEAGAMGYLNKQVVGRHIVAAIRRLLAGKTYLTDATEARLASQLVQNIPSHLKTR